MDENAMASQSGSRVVTVQLGAETFGLPIDRVEGIVPWEPLTRVPRMPAFVAGVLSVRGRVLPIIDLALRLGGVATGADDAHRRIVIMQYDDQWVGYIVDSVNEVRWVPTSAVSADVPVVASCEGEFMSGIAQLGDDLVIMLRPEKLLSNDEQRRAMKLGKHDAAEKAA